MDDDFCIRSFQHEGFDVRIYLAKTEPGTFGGHVDVFETGTHKCRIVLAGPMDSDGAVAALEGKGLDWIAARARGEPDGATNLGALND